MIIDVPDCLRYEIKKVEIKRTTVNLVKSESNVKLQEIDFDSIVNMMEGFNVINNEEATNEVDEDFDYIIEDIINEGIINDDIIEDIIEDTINEGIINDDIIEDIINEDIIEDTIEDTIMEDIIKEDTDEDTNDDIETVNYGLSNDDDDLENIFNTYEDISTLDTSTIDTSTLGTSTIGTSTVDTSLLDTSSLDTPDMLLTKENTQPHNNIIKNIFSRFKGKTKSEVEIEIETDKNIEDMSDDYIQGLVKIKQPKTKSAGNTKDFINKRIGRKENGK